MSFGISPDCTEVIKYCKQKHVFLDETEGTLPKKK